MAGDRQVRDKQFTDLFHAHHEAVRAYAWRRDPDHADDILAETFTVAWQGLDKVPAEPLPWLIGIARNVRLNMRRGERRRQERESRSAQSLADTPTDHAVEAWDELRLALSRLSARDREILLLAAWERLDRAGLATVLGCTKATAAVRLLRARRHLEAALADADASPQRDPNPDAREVLE